MHGLELEQLAVDGCTTRRPSGGLAAGPSPVDRRKQGLKRSVAVEATGLPLHAGHRWVIEHTWGTSTASCAGAPNGVGWWWRSGWRRP
jgi:hypothetical protein